MSATAADYGARIEQLLDEVQATAGPVAWPRIEALVAALVEMYGAGFERLLGLARARTADRRSLDASLAEDELVASLLVLYDLHKPTSGAPGVALDQETRLALEEGAPIPGFVPASRLVRRAEP